MTMWSSPVICFSSTQTERPQLQESNTMIGKASVEVHAAVLYFRELLCFGAYMLWPAICFSLVP